MTLLTVLWSLLALGVIGLALYRKLLASREDDLIHVSAGTEKLIPQQFEMANKLEAIDRWGKILTAAALVLGLTIAAVYLYHAWIQNQVLGQ